ncbi:hypothetical protein I4U23_024918 [Adineta vaga]|nr:hypothetical protein I4U23_024918 [Adineta vaga]
MAFRSEREKSKMHEKHQVILTQMLREEDNKYCVDCDTKSPRWASWNIGVFICIRCAGFHRNLGVHISKVKSVNLDSWTSEQIAAMQIMGNSRARAVYEANLPDGFRRPQSDSTLEAFIRSKYEQRKWIAKEWIPPEMTQMESEINQRSIETLSEPTSMKKSVTKIKPFVMPHMTNRSVQLSPPPVKTPSEDSHTQDLLNLDEPSLPSTNNIAPCDLLDPLQELSISTSGNKNEVNSPVQIIDKDLESAFTFSNYSATNDGGIISNEKIMALFNKPQTVAITPPGMNFRPIANHHSSVSSSIFAYPPSTQHSQFIPLQKSMSISTNLSQHASNIRPAVQQSFPFHSEMHPSTFANNQFVPFTNSKPNVSTSRPMSNIPMRPITEYMSAASDSLWQ